MIVCIKGHLLPTSLIFDMLLRFRPDWGALAEDIEKAFLNIKYIPRIEIVFDF